MLALVVAVTEVWVLSVAVTIVERLALTLVVSVVAVWVLVLQ